VDFDGEIIGKNCLKGGIELDLIKALELASLLANGDRITGPLAGLRERVAEHVLANPIDADSAVTVLHLITETRNGVEEFVNMGIVAMATDVYDKPKLEAKRKQNLAVIDNMWKAASRLLGGSVQELGFPEIFAQGLEDINLDPGKAE